MTKQTQTKSIKAGLITAGVTEIDFANGGQKYTTNVEDLPEETLLKIFDYGKRIFNDAVNGAVHQGKDREEAAQNWLERAKDGTLGSRTGGGSRISPLEKELRAIVEEYLKAAGWKAGDAKKDVKEPKEGFKAMLALQIARGKSIPMEKVEPTDIDKAFEANWPKVETMAKQRLEMTKGLDIEL
jgi:hypothetical protein